MVGVDVEDADRFLMLNPPGPGLWTGDGAAGRPDRLIDSPAGL